MKNHSIQNTHIAQVSPLFSPAELKVQYPTSEQDRERIYQHRHQIEQILAHRCKKFLMIVGPCSIHNVDEALAYAERLRTLSDRVSDRVLLVMRVYFEKPRTILGWKGLIYDPELNGSYDIGKGISVARELLLKIVQMGLPVATEILDPVITQYIADLISWAAIGARTTESQTHRQLVSGLSMPTGFKNTTDGSIKIAIEAIKTANAAHAFLGLTDDGRCGVFRTTGNRYAHLVLRGGANGPNYGSEYIAFSKALMKKMSVQTGIVVDCSHANSGRKPQLQPVIVQELLNSIKHGETSVVGAMVESNLQGGSQSCESVKDIRPGISVTDPCLSWEETEEMVLKAHEMLSV